MLTLTEPTVVPFFFSAARLKTCLPTRLSFIVHVRATASSECEVRTSSQSFDRVVEYDKLVIGGYFSDVMGMERLVAFFAREPVDDNQYIPPGVSLFLKRRSYLGSTRSFASHALHSCNAGCDHEKP